MWGSMKALLIAIVIMALTGCTTIRMTYTGEFKTEDGKTGSVVAEKSYDMGDADSTLCIITGIFLGGSCWFYTVMPTTQQRAQMQSDVESSLRDQLKTSKYSLTTIKNDKMNWEKGEDLLKVGYGSTSAFKNISPSESTSSK